jgi:hypothetical protein
MIKSTWRIMLKRRSGSPSGTSLSAPKGADTAVLRSPCREQKGVAMNILIRIILGIVLLGAGFAVGFPVGQYKGFSLGSEWAMVQADIVAREAGTFMPVYYRDDRFHVVFKQPRGLYTRTRRLADEPDAAHLQKVSEMRIEPRELACLKQ